MNASSCGERLREVAAKMALGPDIWAVVPVKETAEDPPRRALFHSLDQQNFERVCGDFARSRVFQ